jgi:very-short-patch-repair endonuclease
MNSTRNKFYNKQLQPYANKLRKSMTIAEASLWKYVLRARQMKGYQFRRQRPVLNYIADFMCKELNLIIEVDGLTHQFEETAIKDRQKESDLVKAGFSILRFKDEDVLTNIAFVMMAIEDAISEIEKNMESPPPAPASGGN